MLSTMLSDPDADWYGLELCKRARLKPGTIYRILDRLLKVDWLERRWEDIDPKIQGRPRRRLNRLTGVGAPAARQALDEHLAAPQPTPARAWAACGPAEGRVSALLVIFAIVGAIALMVLKALAVDQVKGQVQRSIRASLEATIDALPDELQSEWAEEWRVELGAIITMPVTATRFVHGIARARLIA